MLLLAHATLAADALRNYLETTDSSYAWRFTGSTDVGDSKVHRLRLTSQTWRDINWEHDLLIVRPQQLRNPETAFLLIGGSGRPERYIGLLQTLANSGGALAVFLSEVPNQPLYDGRKEDALIAYTFRKYMETGDETWPLLFPMVKSAVRAMDATQEYASEAFQQSVKRFVVSGASKRGWTTWLTGASDSRVAGIAPMVIDMLNMKAQLDWAQQAYGKQSEKIHDYTELRLHERIDEPPMIRLRSWVDPYAYLDRYRMPKLLLLGTNDPYWVVDSLRHYWDVLPSPKLVHQSPNTGHDLEGGRYAIPTLAGWFALVADQQPIPELKWHHSTEGKTSGLTVEVKGSLRQARLWTAISADRDFRDAPWAAKDIASVGNTIQVSLIQPDSGYLAYMVEAILKTDAGEFSLFTEARVTPDDLVPLGPITK